MGPTSRPLRAYDRSALTATDIGSRVAHPTAGCPSGRVDGMKRQPFGEADMDK